jgi:FkbM family methyltransferase
MRRARTLAWAGGSIVAVLVGSLEPWARGIRPIHSSDDELALAVAVLCACAFAVFALTGTRLAIAVPVLLGVVAVAVVAHDAQDPAGPFGGPGPNIHHAWGIWVALAGLVSLVVASLVLFVEELGLLPRGFLGVGALASRVGRRVGRWNRTAVLAVAQRRWPVVSVEAAGSLLLLSTRDHGISRQLICSGGRRPELVVLDRALTLLRPHGEAPPGSVLLDVGANVGTTALPALTRHGFGRVVAVEPDQDNARLLRAAIMLNGLEQRAEVIEAAASDEPGRQSFRRGRRGGDGWSSGVGRLRRGQSSDEGSIEVEVVTLDGILRACRIDPDDVGLLWVDTQGHEGHALAGAVDLARRGVPMVVALRPRKLRRAGGVEMLVDAVSRYSTIVDLRRPTLKPVPDWRPNPGVVALEELLRSERSTDLLVFGR